LNENSEEYMEYDNEFKRSIDTKVNDILSNVLDGTYDQSASHANVMMDPVTIDEVRKACHGFKNGKAPGYDLITYEHLKYGSQLLYSHLCRLFDWILLSCYIPQCFKVGVVIPLHKGKHKPKNSVKSYRGVTLMPALNKLLEKIIWCRLKPILDELEFPNPQQFACREEHNSTLLSFTVQESINYCLEYQSKAYSCFLDCEQAFDRVWWNGLLYKLHNIGINGRLWLLFREWLLGSKCCVLLDGILSDRFPISRSIKQGGLLSMFFYVVSNSDIHSAVDGGEGLRVNNVNVSSLTLADDTVLLSLTASGLQNMMNRAYQYSKQWRIRFSNSKSKCLVFGETSHGHRINKKTRNWLMGDTRVEEVDSYTHVGIVLRACADPDRMNLVSNRGKGLLASLADVGVRIDGLNPMYSSKLWENMCIPSILYGCEVWYNLTGKDILKLERLQRFAGRLMQGFHLRTHSEIVISLLGWFTILGRVRKAKLLFLRKLTSIKAMSLVKHVFLFRLAQYESDAVYGMQGFIPEIHEILNYYGLSDFIIEYKRSMYFPNKCAWTSVVKEVVSVKENLEYVDSLSKKSLETVVLLAHPSVEIHVLYRLMARFPDYRYQLSRRAKFLTMPEVLPVLCGLCKQIVTNVVIHMFVYCTTLNVIRNAMWDDIIDVVGVELSVYLHNRPDRDQVAIFLGAPWQLERDIHDQFMCTIAKHCCNLYDMFITDPDVTDE